MICVHVEAEKSTRSVMENKKRKLRLPFAGDIEVKIGHPEGEYAHENFLESKYAVDFFLDVHTAIFAVDDGLVIEMKKNFDEYGIDKKFAERANFVVLKHKNGTYSEYVHLGKDKVVVTEGQDVKKGDLVGYTGMSGCMDLPHLHFNLAIVENGKAFSIPVEFKY